jgi:hypothetical protein
MGLGGESGPSLVLYKAAVSLNALVNPTLKRWAIVKRPSGTMSVLRLLSKMRKALELSPERLWLEHLL